MADRTHDDAALRELLGTPRRIAVVGASENPARDSHRILVFLRSRGHDALPVNPVAESVAGIPAVPDLQAAREHWGAPPEVVDVFRAPEHVPGVVEQAVAVGAPWLWLQFGVVHDAAIRRALEAGLEVVVDRCIKVEANRLLGSA